MSVAAFQAAVQNGFNNFANFTGRSSRAEFWLWILFVVLLQVAVNIVGSIAPTVGMLLNLGMIVLVVPEVAYGVRRMHDIDKSGWWIIVPLYSLYLALQPGTPGTNRFGDPSPASAM